MYQKDGLLAWRLVGNDGNEDTLDEARKLRQ